MSAIRHKLITKSHTIGLYDSSLYVKSMYVFAASDLEAAFRFDELEEALKFVEENGSQSDMYDCSERAPLVQLQEICSESLDLSDFSPGSVCEVCM